MKTIVLIGLLTAFNPIQTDSWKIVHGGKMLIQASSEDREKNVYQLTPNDLNPNGFLFIVYT